MAWIESVTGEGSTETPTLLWTNPNPTSSFASQTLNIDLSNYKALIIKNEGSVASVVTSSEQQMSYVDLSETGYVFCSSYIYGNLVLSFRRVTAHTNSSITFGAGFSLDSYNLNVASTNNASVPLEIYGLKL